MDSSNPIIVDENDSGAAAQPTRLASVPGASRQAEDGTCHMLPCSIDYQGMASTHVYFHPVIDDGVAYSTFRGRGMIALSPIETEEDDNTHLSAALISIQNSKLQIKAEVDKILEWQHEHNPESLFIDSGETTSRVQVAKDWSEVALALHEPLPID